MKFSYRKEIDFLRAVAVIYVIAFHFFQKIVPHGYLGVDLFFVISGFLISMQIYNLLIINKFSMKNFYFKRVKRILPATFFLLICTSIISVILLTKNDLYLFSESALFSATFLANFHFWFIGGYFAAADELKILLHLWSLGVEEQFYIFFPIIFLFIFKFTKDINKLIIIVSIITFLSLSTNFFIKNLGLGDTAFFLLPTRIWNLSFGILAMLIFVKKNKYHNNYLATVYLIVILLSILIKIPGIPSDILLITFTAIFLSRRLPQNFPLTNIIENKYLNFIGLISFSLYLWHWPVLVFFKYYYVDNLNIIIKVLAIVIVFFSAYLSYMFIEKKFRYDLNYKKVINLLIIMFSFIIIISLVNIFNKKIKVDEFYEKISKNSYTNYKCKFTNFTNYNLLKACLINRSKNNINSVALIGNSHIQMYVPSFEPSLKNKNLQAILISNTGCLPSINLNINESCLNRSIKYFNKYSEDKEIKTIIIATTWQNNQLYDVEKNLLNDPFIIGKSIINLVRELEKKNKKVFVLGPIQRPSYDFPQDLSRLIKFKHINKTQIQKEIKIEKSIFEKNYSSTINLLEKELGENFINISDTFCNDNFCFLADEKGSYFADDGHLSNYGAKLLINKVKFIFK